MEHPKSRLDQLFQAGITLKLIDGILEIIGGGLLLFVKPDGLNHLVVTLTQRELVEDSRDFIANHLLHFTHHLTGAAILFGALYLTSHGLVKVWLVVEVWRQRLWAYQGLILFTSGFMVYQIYRISYTHSLGLTLLTLYDGWLVYLTAREYKKTRRLV